MYMCVCLWVILEEKHTYPGQAGRAGKGKKVFRSIRSGNTWSVAVGRG